MEEYSSGKKPQGNCGLMGHSMLTQWLQYRDKLEDELVKEAGEGEDIAGLT